MPIPRNGIQTCTSGIRAHRASDYTTRAGTPRFSRSKHFRHSPASSIVKQSCMKHSNSYMRDRDVRHLQGPPVCVCVWGGGGGVEEVRVCVRACVREHILELCAAFINDANPLPIIRIIFPQVTPGPSIQISSSRRTLSPTR